MTSVSAVATALWAVALGVKTSAELDRPQAGGYNRAFRNSQGSK